RLNTLKPESLKSLLSYASAQEKRELARLLDQWRQQVEAEQFKAAKQAAERSLYEFVRQAWPAVEPDQGFIDNWHIGLICAHLEHAVRTRNYALLINIPPGCMKSRLVSVLWPAWVWGPAGWPEARFMFASYGQDLSTRDSMDCRALIE